MYQLTCEGVCNRGRVAVLDVELRQLTKYDAEPVGEQSVWERQRRLQHTPHQAISPYTAKCLECGKERRYGNAGF
jgi:hypothetical protein